LTAPFATFRHSCTPNFKEKIPKNPDFRKTPILGISVKKMAEILNPKKCPGEVKMGNFFLEKEVLGGGPGVFCSKMTKCTLF